MKTHQILVVFFLVFLMPNMVLAQTKDWVRGTREFTVLCKIDAGIRTSVSITEWNKSDSGKFSSILATLANQPDNFADFTLLNKHTVANFDFKNSSVTTISDPLPSVFRYTIFSFLKYYC